MSSDGLLLIIVRTSNIAPNTIISVIQVAEDDFNNEHGVEILLDAASCKS
jgi:hypothetical protein